MPKCASGRWRSVYLIYQYVVLSNVDLSIVTWKLVKANLVERSRDEIKTINMCQRHKKRSKKEISNFDSVTLIRRMLYFPIETKRKSKESACWSYSISCLVRENRKTNESIRYDRNENPGTKNDVLLSGINVRKPNKCHSHSLIITIHVIFVTVFSFLTKPLGLAKRDRRRDMEGIMTLNNVCMVRVQYEYTTKIRERPRIVFSEHTQLDECRCRL